RDVGGRRRGAAVIGRGRGIAGADIVATGHVGRRGCGAVIVRRRGGLDGVRSARIVDGRRGAAVRGGGAGPAVRVGAVVDRRRVAGGIRAAGRPVACFEVVNGDAQIRPID